MSWKRWVLTAFAGLILFIFFLVLTFPWDRLAPKIASETEKALSQSLRDDYHCEITNFSLAFPLGIEMDRFECADQQGEILFSFDEVKAILLPFFQSLSAKLGDGVLDFQTDVGPSGKPSKLELELSQVDLKRLLPLIFSINNAAFFATPVQLDVEGSVTGSASIPLTEPYDNDGHLQLNFQNLRLPSQLYLDLIGLREIKLNPAVVDIELQDGDLNFKEVALISQELAGKIEGNLKLNEELQNSEGNVLLKWKVQRSDALLSSPIGSQLLSAPCPSPDPQGYCTRRITKLSEVSNLFQPSGFR